MNTEIELYEGLGDSLAELESRFTSGLQNPADWLVDSLGGRTSKAGVRVSPATAMGFVAYFACIRNISDDIAKLPIEVIRRSGDNREILRDHPVAVLLNRRPNAEMTAFDFRRTLTSHSLGFQGGFAEIVRDIKGNPIALWPLDPTRMEVRRGVVESSGRFGDTNLFRDDPSERIVYIYHTDKQTVAFDPDVIFHLHNLSFNGIAAAEITAIAKDAIGAALATQEQNSKFFANGAMSSGVIEHPGSMGPDALKHLRESFDRRHAGSSNAYRTIILEEDAKYSQTSVDPERAQMIESMNWHVVNVARLFRMPPHKIQDLERATFSNIEEQNREYATDTLEPHSTTWDQVSEWKLLMHPREDDLDIRHNFRALIKADSEKQNSFYASGITHGYLSVNDVRRFEDMDPVEDGDTYLRPVNLTPIDTEPEPAEPSVAPAQSGHNSDHEDEEDNRAQIIRAFEPLMQDAIWRVLRIEIDKTKRGKEWDRHELWCRELSPVAAALAGHCPGEWILVRGVSHDFRSDDELKELGVDKAIEYWRGDRAKDEAKEIIEGILEAIK